MLIQLPIHHKNNFISVKKNKPQNSGVYHRCKKKKHLSGMKEKDFLPSICQHANIFVHNLRLGTHKCNCHGILLQCKCHLNTKDENFINKR